MTILCNTSNVAYNGYEEFNPLVNEIWLEMNGQVFDDEIDIWKHRWKG